MFGQDHQEKSTTQEGAMDNSVAAAAESYEETPVAAPATPNPTLVSPTTPPPPPPPPLSAPTSSPSSISLPSIQPSVPVTLPKAEVLETAPAIVPEAVALTGAAATGTPATPVSTSTASATASTAPPAATSDGPETMEDLFLIKQDALHDLSPLITHLDQSPEERFRTLMMMIQASDDQDLIRPAYEAAHQIADEKIRAQALLDIVNEINYFTQHQSQQ